MDFYLGIAAYNCLNNVGSAMQSSVLNNVFCFGSLQVALLLSGLT